MKRNLLRNLETTQDSEIRKVDSRGATEASLHLHPHLVLVSEVHMN